MSQLWVWCNAATINLYIPPVIVFLSRINTFWIHNHSKPVQQLAPNKGCVRENTIHVNIDLLGRTYIEPVFVICWNYLGGRELQYIVWPSDQQFSLSFWSKLADPTCCYCPHCHLSIQVYLLKKCCPLTLRLRVLDCYWNNTPWDNDMTMCMSV